MLTTGGGIPSGSTGLEIFSCREMRLPAFQTNAVGWLFLSFGIHPPPTLGELHKVRVESVSQHPLRQSRFPKRYNHPQNDSTLGMEHRSSLEAAIRMELK
jgi:hypothetical protein